MTIDTSGEHWKGTEAADLEPFLRDYEAGGYPVTRVVQARCGCGATRFEVSLSDDGDAVSRACARCGEEVRMLDSAEHWDEDGEHDECACPCEGEVFEAAVGFALREDGSVKWVSVGLRCVECGILGTYADWKIDYEPSAGLLDRV